MELGDRSNLEVEIDVLSSDAVMISPGSKIYLEHWGSKSHLLARVRLVEPQGFLKVSALGVEEQRFNVIADFVDPLEVGQRLGDAYRVEAKIVIWDADNVLKVNAGARRVRGARCSGAHTVGRGKVSRLAVREVEKVESRLAKNLKMSKVAKMSKVSKVSVASLVEDMGAAWG